MPSTIKISEIQLFNSLKEKLGEQQGESLVTYLKSSVKDEVNEQIPQHSNERFC